MQADGAGQGIGGDQIVLWGLYRGRAHGKLSVLHSTCTTDLNRSEVKRVKSQECCGTYILWGFSTSLVSRDFIVTLPPQLDQAFHLAEKVPWKRIKSANKKRRRQQQRQQAVSSLELKYNLRRCIYSHTFNKPERCKWVPEYLKGKQKNKGKVSIHNRSRFQRVNTAARTASAVVFPKVQNVVQKKSLTVSRISEHPYLYISFFSPSSWNTETVSNIRQSYLMTKPRTNACIIFCFIPQYRACIQRQTDYKTKITCQM